MAVELRFRQVLEGQQAQTDMKKSARELGEEAKRTEKEFRELQKTTGATGAELQRAKTAAEQAAAAYKKAQADVRSLTEEMTRLRNEGKQASEPFRNLSSEARLFSSASSVMQGNLAGISREIATIGKLSGSGVFTPLIGGAALAGTALVAVGTAIAKLTLDQAALAKEQQNNAIRTGLTLKEYGVWSQVAANAGVNAQALVTSMRTLSKAMDENSEEGKVAKRALDQLFGGTAQAAQAANQPTMQFLLSIADAMDKIPSASRRAELAIQIFGKGGVEQLPILNSHLPEMLKNAEEAGVGFDELSSKGLKDLDKKIQDANTQWTVFKQNIAETAAGPMADMLGILNQLLAGFNKLPRLLKERIGVQAVSGAFGAPGAAAADVIELFGSSGDPQQDAEARKAQQKDQETKEFLERQYRFQRQIDARNLEALDKQRPIYGNAEQQKVEALEAQLSEAKKKYAEDKKVFDVPAATADKQRIDALTFQIAHTKELAAVEKQLNDQRQAALDARKDEEWGPEYKTFANRDKQLRDLSEKGTLSQADRARLTAQINGTADIEWTTLGEKIQRELAQDGLRDDQKRGKQYSDEDHKNLADYLKQQEQEDAKAADARVKNYDVGFNRQRQDLVSDANRQQRIGELTADGNPAKAAEQSLNRQLGLAQQLYSLDERRVAMLKDLADKEIYDAEKKKLEGEAELAETKAKVDLEEANRKAQEDYALKQLELLKQQRQEANQLGQELFQAATSRGGFRRFYQGLGEKTATTIAGNVLENPLKSVLGGLGSLGQASGLGGILKGTLFDPKNAALDANTAALNDLTATLGGTPTSTASVPGSTLAAAHSAAGAAAATGPLAAVFNKIPGYSQFSGAINRLASGAPLFGSAGGGGVASYGPGAVSLNQAALFSALGFGSGGNAGAAPIVSAIGGDGAYALPFSAPVGAPASVQSVIDAMYPSGSAALPSEDGVFRTTVYGSSAADGSLPLSQVKTAFGLAAGDDSQTKFAAAQSALKSASGLFGSGSGTFGNGVNTFFREGYSGLQDAITGDSGAGFAENAGTITAAGTTLAAGTLGVISGIQRGGIRGYSSAIGSGLGTAAAFDPEPISKGILMIGSLAASLFSAFGPDPYKARQDQITRAMRQDQWFAPEAMSSTRDLYGNQLGYNYRGTLGAVGQTYQNTIVGWNSNYTQPIYANVPTSPAPAGAMAAPAPVAGSAGGSAAGSPGAVPLIGSLHITAFDSKSIADNHGAIAEGVYRAAQAGNPLLQAGVAKSIGLTQ